MAVRNFYIDADIDGRRTSLSGGPQAKDGGLSATVLIRDEGSILRAVQISAIARRDGSLALEVTPCAGVPRAAIEPADDGQGFVITTKR